MRDADQRGEPLLILGGGSNLVIADAGFPGTVVQVATKGIQQADRMPDWIGEPGRSWPGPPERTPVTLTVAAGEDWDSVVASCVAADLAGLECLSGIPGPDGATPIQNVGAYGQEVADTITRVRVYDRDRAEVVELAAGGLRVRLPDQRVQAEHQPPAVTGRFVVLGVTFQLTATGVPAGPVRRAGPGPGPGSRRTRPADRGRSGEGGRAPLGDVRAAVLRLRRGKGMVLDPGDPDSRSAGSFFTNPILDAAQFARLRRVVDERGGPDVPIPQFPAGPGQVKVPAAWLIGQAGFQKGYQGAGGGRPGGGPDLHQAHAGPGQPGRCEHGRGRRPGPGDPRPGP